MFSEVMKLIPKLDEKELRAMQTSLQSRFTKLAKGFGKGFVNALKGGGIAAIGLALIDKVLNPLKETQEAIDRMLKSSDDIAVNAKQFNTTSGRLFKLVQLAKANGLESENLFMLMNKFQTSVAQAKADPTNPENSAVLNFRDRTDTAEAFFEFIQSVQKMDKNQQLLVQQQVFGEKQILRMAEFLQDDFAKTMKETGLDKASGAELSAAINSMSEQENLQNKLRAGTETRDTIAKGSAITDSMIIARNKSEEKALEKENKRIQSYDDLAALHETGQNLEALVETGVQQLGHVVTELLPKVNQMVTFLEKYSKSPMVKGITNMFGKKDK